MLLTLVKNNLKLMLREKMTMIFLIVLPVFFIALLSSAFSKELNKNYTIDPFSVGYNVEAGSRIGDSFQGFINNFKENKITLLEMKRDKGIEAIKNGSLSVYIELNDDKYTIYKKDGLDVNTMIFENSISTAMYFYDGNKALINYLMEKGLPVEINNGVIDGNKNFIKLETLKVDPVPTSEVYYGIVEIAYFIWFGMMAASNLVSNERKYGVTDRIGLTTASSLTLFFGNLISAVLVIFVQIAIATIFSTILIGVDWGTSPILSITIIILEIIACSALGIVLSLLIKSQALVNVLIVLFGFLFGFIGGSNQTYMYNFVSDNVAKISPLYHINRTLVELSTKGYSDYTNSCIIFLLAISMISVIIGILTTAKGREAL